jgi:altronate dehydratase large subunit
MPDSIRVYVRDNGAVGIRDVLLALPAVVCSNEAARLAVEGLPDGVTLEHPVGCAQIGADKDQTWRTLVGIGAHPNVRETVVVGLGCEGIVAATLAHGIQERGRRASVVTIQDMGGTSKAAEEARTRLSALVPTTRTATVSVGELVLGVGDIRPLGSRGRDIVGAWQALGGRVVWAYPPAEDHLDGTLDYAEWMPATRRACAMQPGSGDAETITGLAATGAHLILAAGDVAHLGGHPVCPVIRVGYDATARRALADDLDGQVDDRTPRQWAEYLVAVAGGQPTASEALGTAVFAIQRIGPTL